jgi:Domain of unknown function (DUF4279)
MPDSSELMYLCGGEIDAGEFSVSITSENLDPDALAQQLGLQPTASHRRDDTFGKASRRYGYGEWRFATGRLDFRSGKSCEEQFDDFVRSLPADTAVWERIAAEHEARVFIVLWMRTWNREFDISTFALGELARRKLQLHIDTYLESDDDDDA